MDCFFLAEVEEAGARNIDTYRDECGWFHTGISRDLSNLVLGKQ
jgi:hypothetical protein